MGHGKTVKPKKKAKTALATGAAGVGPGKSKRFHMWAAAAGKSHGKMVACFAENKEEAAAFLKQQLYVPDGIDLNRLEKVTVFGGWK